MPNNQLDSKSFRSKFGLITLVLILGALVLLLTCLLLLPNSAQSPITEGEAVEYRMDNNGVMPLPALQLPLSGALSAKSKTEFLLAKQHETERKSEYKKQCGKDIFEASIEELPSLRDCRAQVFYNSSWYRDMQQRYAVDIKLENYDGVETEVFTPLDGILPNNRDKVLINLHFGGFAYHAKQESRLESMPIAALMRIKVVSPDYRMYPEHRYPSAVSDVLSVYRTLLKTYRPENIGIYGCSAGGNLTARTIPWLLKEELPLPAAVAMLGGAADVAMGDSHSFGFAASGIEVPDIDIYNKGLERPSGYYEGVDNLFNPLVFPARSPETMKAFPPSLLISSTRDYLLSHVLFTHSQLVKQGVEADLHVWEGLEHCFTGHGNIPESRDAYGVLIGFFNKHLGRSAVSDL